MLIIINYVYIYCNIYYVLSLHHNNYNVITHNIHKM